MKLNAGVITQNLQQTKEFYTQKLWFWITFESDWYILFHTPNHEDEIAFLLPNLDSQAPIFRDQFNGKGLFLTIEVDNVDDFYTKIQDQNIDIAVPLKDEEWGDRHFAIIDPNGIGIDFVTHTSQE